MTVREMVKDVQMQLLGDVTPQVARESLMSLAGLLPNVLAEVREAEIAYSHALRAAYGTEAKANRAKILAETGPEYARMREAQDTEKFLMEAQRSCRRFLESLDSEMRLSR